MARMLDWVRLPTQWIQDGGLKELRWDAGEGSDRVAALMVLIALAHRAEANSGEGHATYDGLMQATGLSRAKIAKGLDVLSARNLVTRGAQGRSSFALVDYDLARGWAKLPARPLYSGGRIAAFADFHLRKAAELNALKLYLLFVARRGNDTNLAQISYDKITEYTGLDRNRIKQALTLLAIANLVHVERVPSDVNDFAVSNAYRITHIDSYAHMGTRGRASDDALLGREP